MEEICAAAHGSLSCLKEAHEQKIPLCSYTLYHACVRGHVECVSYILQTKPLPQFVKSMLRETITNNHLACINLIFEYDGEEYGVDGNLGFAKTEIQHALNLMRFDIIDYLFEYIVTHVSESKISEFLHSIALSCCDVNNATNLGYIIPKIEKHIQTNEFKQKIISDVLYKNNLACLIYLYERGYPLTNAVIQNISNNANFAECYQYLVSMQTNKRKEIP